MTHSLPTFTAKDMARRAADLFVAAIKSPVAVTKNNTPRLIVMSVEEYERLQARARAGDPRRAYTLDDVPNDVRDEMLAAIDAEIGPEMAPSDPEAGSSPRS